MSGERKKVLLTNRQVTSEVLDGAIINPLDHRMMVDIITAEAVADKDSFCMNYFKVFGAGVFE